MNRLNQLREQIAQQNKGLHYLKQSHESDFVESLCAEIDAYRKDISGVIEECSKHITLSNDFPWAEEVHCAFRSPEQKLATPRPESPDAQRGEVVELLLQVRNDAKLWKRGGPGGQDSYAGLPPAMRLIDTAIKKLTGELSALPAKGPGPRSEEPWEALKLTRDVLAWWEQRMGTTLGGAHALKAADAAMAPPPASHSKQREQA